MKITAKKIEFDGLQAPLRDRPPMPRFIIYFEIEAGENSFPVTFKIEDQENIWDAVQIAQERLTHFAKDFLAEARRADLGHSASPQG